MMIMNKKVHSLPSLHFATFVKTTKSAFKMLLFFYSIYHSFTVIRYQFHFEISGSIELSGVEITRADCINTVLKYQFWLDVYHKRLGPYHEGLWSGKTQTGLLNHSCELVLKVLKQQLHVKVLYYLDNA